MMRRPKSSMRVSNENILNIIRISSLDDPSKENSPDSIGASLSRDTTQIAHTSTHTQRRANSLQSRTVFTHHHHHIMSDLASLTDQLADNIAQVSEEKECGSVC